MKTPTERRDCCPLAVLNGCGPARVLLGSYGSATSAIKAPSPMNYLAVRLKAGERWSYQPPTGHTVLWTAVGIGSVLVPDELQQGDLVALRPSSAAIEFEAQSDAEFVLGSAVPHQYDLILGSHSVHTSAEALREAERANLRDPNAPDSAGQTLNNRRAPRTGSENLREDHVL